MKYVRGSWFGGWLVVIACCLGCGAPRATRTLPEQPADDEPADVEGRGPAPASPALDGAAPPGSALAEPADSSLPPAADAAAGDGAAAAADRRPDFDTAPEAAFAAPACAASGHVFCSDFESGVFDPRWSHGSSETIETGRAAHGKYSVHIKDLMPRTYKMLAIKVPAPISKMIWVRFYMYIEKVTPIAYGPLAIAESDRGSYGLQYGGHKWFYNWYSGQGEGVGNSNVTIPVDRWMCVEFFIDGTTPSHMQVWQDGVRVSWYGSPLLPPFTPVTRFTSFKVGFGAKQGTSAKDYAGATPPATTDLWIDDVALDTKRIGCL